MREHPIVVGRGRGLRVCNIEVTNNGVYDASADRGRPGILARCGWCSGDDSE